MPRLKSGKTATRYIFTKEEEELLDKRMANEKYEELTPQLWRKIRQGGLRKLRQLKNRNHAS